MWFLGVFTTLIMYPSNFNVITIYWVNGSITIAGLLSLHLWLMNANMYHKKNGNYLKLLFLPGIVMLMTLPFDSWMLRGDINSVDPLFMPGPGLYLLWFIDFSYLAINLILTIFEMKKGNSAAKLWFKGILLYFIWTISMLIAAIVLQGTDLYFFFYFIPHGTLFWAIAIFLSMSRFDYLSSYEKRYKILFQRSPLGILIMDEETIVLEASPKVPEYLGVSRDELIHSPLLSFLKGIDEHQFIKDHHLLFQNKIKLENLELSFYNKFGKHITLLIDSDFIMIEGKTLQFVMIKDITEAKVKEERVQYLAYHDILTGLSNRAAFEKQISSLLNRKEKFNFILFDLNKLKYINDTFGHQTGDHAIKFFAGILQEVSSGQHHATRLGGDEFVLLLSINEPDLVINEISQKLSKPLELENQEKIHLSVSIGVSHYPFDGKTMDQLYSVADKRMYTEKKRANKEIGT